MLTAPIQGRDHRETPREWGAGATGRGRCSRRALGADVPLSSTPARTAHGHRCGLRWWLRRHTTVQPLMSITQNKPKLVNGISGEGAVR